jgi:hypothetical protein
MNISTQLSRAASSMPCGLWSTLFLKKNQLGTAHARSKLYVGMCLLFYYIVHQVQYTNLETALKAFPTTVSLKKFQSGGAIGRSHVFLGF